jgi:hypothetical protein
LLTQTYGGRPVNRPAPPRTIVSAFPSTSQLKPSRGDRRRLPLGTCPVSMGNAAFVARAGLVFADERIGTSMRKPGVMVRFLNGVHSSCA